MYIRETFAVGKIDYGEEPDGRSFPYISQCKGENDIIPKEWAIRNNIGIDEVKWKPSIHMPKEASRIFLKIIDIKVERIQDINANSLMKEGILSSEDFKNTWNKIYKEKGYCWDKNPYVWVIEFEKIGRIDY